MAAAILGAALSEPARPAAQEFTGPSTDALSSSHATCSDLRAATEGLDGEGPDRVDLTVTGALTFAEFDGALVYLTLCAPPDPQVLCVTYALNGMEEGDFVVASGNYRRPDPDHILLDPCLASPADVLP